MSDLRWLDDAEDPARIALRRGLDESERFSHSELRQRRVWARVSDPARTFRATRLAFVRGALVASALTALALVAVGRVSQVSQVSQVSIDGARGGAVATHAETAAAPGAAEATQTTGTGTAPVVAPAGAAIETREGERLVRLLPRGARAEIAPHTLLAVDAQGRPELRRGEVQFSVAHAADASDEAHTFSVRIASYRVVVAGARFVVKAEAQSISVAVEDGEAEIWNGARMVRIGSGETWSSTDAQAAPAADKPARPSAPHAAREHAPTLAPAATAAQDAQDSEDLAAARAARAAADPHRALSLYEHLAARTGPVAENAMYEIGGVYHDQLRQPAKAVAAWDRYRARYPNGLLRAEADLSVIDTLATLEPSGDGTRTLDEALGFLKRYPHSERRGEVARVVGDLYRGRGNCRAALEFYRVVQGAKLTSEDADEASFGQAACLYSLRDDGANGALRAYLAQNPHGHHAADAARLLGDKANP